MVRKTILKVSSYGLLTASALSTACGSRSNQSSSLIKITNGQEIQDAQYPAVVLLLMVNAKEEYSICTGTFVSDYQLITAAHCVAELDLNRPKLFYSQVEMRSKEQPSYQVIAQARRVHLHPEFASEERTNNIQPHDLAIVEFPISTAPDTVRIADWSPEPDAEVTLVGFGDQYSYVNQKGLQSGRGAGIKRLGTNKVESKVDGMIVFAGLSQNDEYFGIGEWAATGTGDSGGPLFHEGHLAGITSGGQLKRNRKGGWVAVSHYVDLSLAENMKFIREHIH